MNQKKNIERHFKIMWLNIHLRKDEEHVLW